MHLRSVRIKNFRLWVADFEARCHSWVEGQKPLWQVKWMELCDGKALLQDLHKELKMNVSVAVFKKRIMVEMKNRGQPNWIEMESDLRKLITGSI